MIDCRPVDFSARTLQNYVELFAQCFPQAVPFTEHYLRWLYCSNPDGHAVGFDAWDGDRLVAHYVCIPGKAQVAGVDTVSLLSLNSATHPAYQGQGLFTRLATLTYARGAELGYGCIYGIANANSTGGFVRKLGFQLVQPLKAYIGIGSPGIDCAAAHREAEFSRQWTSQSLTWRINNPRNVVRTVVLKDRIAFCAKANLTVQAYTELPLVPGYTAGTIASTPVSPARLSIGLWPNHSARHVAYLDIPMFARPSPLNFIYRALTDLPAHIDPDRALISFLDFDAY